jgi:hypothetical protein
MQVGQCPTYTGLHLVDTMDQVLAIALRQPPPTRSVLPVEKVVKRLWRMIWRKLFIRFRK